MAFKLVTIGLQSAITNLGELQQIMAQVNPSDMKAMSSIALKDVYQHFDDSGPNWKPRKPSTLRRIRFNTRAKRRRKDIAVVGNKLLLATKRLKKSNKVVFIPKGFAIRNTDPKLHFHEFGTRYMVARSSMYFSEKAFNAMMQVPFQRLQRAVSKLK